MDCVTCMLVGMCMLCGPGFGAGEHGRPITREEINTGLKNYLKQFDRQAPNSKVAPVPNISYNRRQSFIADPKFSFMGIGKRQQMDEHKYPTGYGRRELDYKPYLNSIGRRHIETKPIQEIKSVHYGEDLPLSSGAGRNNWAMPLPRDSAHFHSNFYQKLFNRMSATARNIEKGNKFLENERRKLRARRVKFGVDPFTKMFGIA